MTYELDGPPEWLTTCEHDEPCDTEADCLELLREADAELAEDMWRDDAWH